LRVISSTSAMVYKGSAKRLPEIAKELNVDGVIEGTVQRSGDRVRISVQLIDARTDAHLWASEYDREIKDVFAVQGEVANAVAGHLRLLLTSGQQARFQSKPTVVPAALEAYTRGRSHWYKRWQGGEPDLRTAGSYFEQAVQLDPQYAAAYSGVADYYAFLAIYGLEPPAGVWPKSEQALQRALELDPQLGEAQISLAVSRLYWHWDFQGARQASDRALELNPNYSEAYSFRSTLFSTMGRFDESIAAARKAEELDPIGQFGRYLLSLARAHRYQQLERDARAIIPKDPSFGWAFVSTALIGQGHMDEAFAARLKSLQLNGDVERVNAYKAAFPNGGHRALARWEIQRTIQRANGKYIAPFGLAALYARAGQIDEMYKSLESAYREHAALMVFLNVDNGFDGLREDPRFADLVRRVGLPSSEPVEH
jgi:tetratricopeptide (TPR) repeat protein